MRTAAVASDRYPALRSAIGDLSLDLAMNYGPDSIGYTRQLDRAEACLRHGDTIQAYVELSGGGRDTDLGAYWRERWQALEDAVHALHEPMVREGLGA